MKTILRSIHRHYLFCSTNNLHTFYKSKKPNPHCHLDTKRQRQLNLSKLLYVENNLMPSQYYIPLNSCKRLKIRETQWYYIDRR